jgi:hypothetical protein
MTRNYFRLARQPTESCSKGKNVRQFRTNFLDVLHRRGEFKHGRGFRGMLAASHPDAFSGSGAVRIRSPYYLSP